MSLQARNLLPGIAPKSVGDDTRAQLLQETQAAFEKLASRQR
jgi:hypothetical protein